MGYFLVGPGIRPSVIDADLQVFRQPIRRLERGKLDILVGNAGILGSLPWSEWIGQAAYVKADVVNRDFREQGPRRALNLGHTLGHVLEAWSHESDEPLTHGAAVSIGMAVVFRIAAERGTCPLPTAVQVIELLEACGLPITYACPPAEKLTRLLGSDKKVSALGGVRWVLPRKVGLMDLDGRVTADEIRKWLA